MSVELEVPSLEASQERGVTLLSEPSPYHMADDWYRYASADHFWFQWRMAALIRLLDGLDLGDRLLEVGCGNGVARRQLHVHYGREIAGCDLNLVALHSAEQGGGSLYLYNVHDRRPQWQRHFSSVFLLDTLEHIDDPVSFLDSIRYHLRDEALLVVTVPALQWLYSRYDEAQGHVKRYQADLLRRELTAAGFRLLRHTYWGFSLLPIIALRKAVLRCTSPTKVVATGFQPCLPAVHAAFRGLMQVETRLLPCPPVGTSLVAVAQPVR